MSNHLRASDPIPYCPGELIDFLRAGQPLNHDQMIQVLDYFEGTLARHKSEYEKGIKKKERERKRLQEMIEKYKVERW